MRVRVSESEKESEREREREIEREREEERERERERARQTRRGAAPRRCPATRSTNYSSFGFSAVKALLVQQLGGIGVSPSCTLRRVRPLPSEERAP